MMKHKILLSIFFIIILKSAYSQANLQWAKSIGGSLDDVGFSTISDVAGNVYTTGSFIGTVDFNPGAGIFNLTASGSDIFISKLDASGNFVWAKQLGGPSNDEGLSITLDAFGNLYTTGYFRDTSDFDPGAGTFNLISAGVADVFVSKLDASGNFVWAKRIGGGPDAAGLSIVVDSYQNVYSAGYFYGTVDFDPGTPIYNLTSYGATDIFVTKLNPSGTFAWAKNLGGIGYDQAFSIAVDLTGNIFTTGTFQNIGDFDPGASTFNLTGGCVFVSKLDSLGNFVWAKSLGGTSDDIGYSVITDAIGNIYTTGYYTGIADFDPGPSVFNLTSTGTYGDIFLSKLNSLGDFVWAKSIGGTGIDVGNSLALDANGNLYSIGYFNSTVDFNPGIGVNNISSTGQNDIFICKLDSVGNFLWAEQFSGLANEIGYSISVNSLGDVIATGTFESTVDFNPGAGTSNLNSFGLADIFIIKLSDITGINESNNIRNINICPNPNSGLFNYSIDLQSESNLQIAIYDVTGQLIKLIPQTKLNSGSNLLTIDVSELANGIYFLKAFNENIQQTSKFVKNK